MNINNRLKEIFNIKKLKTPHYISIDFKYYLKYKYIIKLIVFLNRRYTNVEIFRKNYLNNGDIVIIGLRYYGNNVRRRTNGYAKKYLVNNPNTKCIYCEGELNESNITTEHILPISKRGNNTKVNLITCCGDCNRERGNEDFYTFLKRKNKRYNKIKYIFI